MRDDQKSKKQLIEELRATRKQLKRLQTSVAQDDQADEALKKSEERLSSFMNSASDSFYLLDSGLHFTEINMRGLEIIGKRREEVIGKHITEIVPDIKESGRYDQHLRVLKTGKPFVVEDFLPHPIFGDRHFILRSFKVGDGLGVIASDITSLKQAEINVRIEKEFTETALNAQQDTFFVFNPSTGEAVHWNKAFNEISGYSDEEIVTMIAPDDWYDEEDLKKAAQSTENISNVQQATFEMSLISKDGKRIPTEYSASPIFDEEGNLQYIIAIGRDITERKQAEDIIRQREEEIRAFIETSRDWIWSIDIDGIHTYSNPAVEEILGYSPDDLVGNLSLDFLYDEDRKKIEAELPIWREEKTGWRNLVLKWRHKDGSLRWLESNAVPILSTSGDFLGFRGVDRDITERKLAEDALRLERDFNLNLIETSPTFFATIDAQGKTVSMNKFLLETLGYSENEVVGTDYVSTFVPENDRQKVKKIFFEQLRENEKTVNENYIETKDGRKLLVEWHGCPVLDQEGKVNLFFGVGVDITERKQAEEKLRISEEKFNKAFHKNPNPMVMIDLETRTILEVNETYTRISGYDPENIVNIPKKFGFSITSQEKLNRMFELLETNQSLTGYEIEMVVKDGEIKSGLVSAEALVLQGKRLFVLTMVDITERKRAEEAYRTLVEKSLQGLAIIQNNRIVFTNEAFGNIYGYTTEELLSFPPDKVRASVHEEDQSLVWGRLKKRMEGKPVPDQYEFRIIRKDGMVSWVQTFATFINYKGNPAVQIAQIDVTERREAEQRLFEYQKNLRSLAFELARIEERERRKIASDLHDRIGHLLAVSKMKFSELEIAVSSLKPDGMDMLRESQDLLDQAIQETRSLTFEVSPTILYELGFEAAVEWLAEHFQEKYSLKTKIIDDGLSKPMDNEIRIILFRAIQESLMNVLKHAKTKLVGVWICRQHEKIRIDIKDKGVGFTHAKRDMSSQTGGFGLFNIRERLDYIGGECSIESHPGKGTKVTLIAPLISINEGS